MRVAVCQMNAGEDLAANLETAEQLLGDAASQGAALATLPEVFTFLGRSSAHGEIAEPVPGGPASDLLARAARTSGMWVLGGSLIEREGARVYNTSVLFDRAGELVARYRKIHLFDVELPGQAPLRESASYTPGEQLVTHEVDELRVGLSICYDVRFPELYRGLMTLGANLMLVPAAFTAMTGAAHWEVLLRARAIENQCFVAAPAQWGSWGAPGEPRRCHGHSMIVDPWGRVIVCAPEEGTGVWSAELDPRELQRVRSTLPALRHRRLGPSC